MRALDGCTEGPPASSQGSGRADFSPASGRALVIHSAIAILIAGLLIAAQAAFIPVKAQLAQVLLNEAWDRSTASGGAERPWPWADFTPVARLGLPGGPGIIALSDAAGESLAFGPTLVSGSAPPGEPGVAVFAAHRDTHFSAIGALVAGDILTVETARGRHSFAVTGSEVVRWDDSGIEPRDGGSPRVALVSCWPLDAQTQGPLRYVVWARLIGE